MHHSIYPYPIIDIVIHIYIYIYIYICIYIYIIYIIMTIFSNVLWIVIFASNPFFFSDGREIHSQVVKPEDGSSRTRYYGDSRLGVYISPVPLLAQGAYTPWKFNGWNLLLNGDGISGDQIIGLHIIHLEIGGINWGYTPDKTNGWFT